MNLDIGAFQKKSSDMPGNVAKLCVRSIKALINNEILWIAFKNALVGIWLFKWSRCHYLHTAGIGENSVTIRRIEGISRFGCDVDQKNFFGARRYFNRSC